MFTSKWWKLPYEMGNRLILFERNRIDDVRWDESIRTAHNGNVYAYSWYLDAISPNWCALATEDYTAVMPLPFSRKYFIDYVFTPPYCQQLGVFSKHQLGEDVFLAFIESIPLHFRFVDLNLNHANSKFQLNVTSYKNRNLILNLNGTADEIKQLYSTNHKRNIRKCEEAGLVTMESDNVDGVIAMFESDRGGRLGNYPDKKHIIFRELYRQANERKMAKVYLTMMPDGKPVAGAVFFLSHEGACFIFSGNSEEGKAHSAMHGLIHHFIVENAGKYSFLDFEGSNNDSLARFYSGFGASESVYLRITRNLLPPPWCWFKKG
jgi:hypothetical protein